MREYKGSEIRNIAVVGHGASGKTSLVDALAFVSGSSKRHGSVKDGTALTDHAAEEIERGYSINLGPRLRRVAGHQDQPHRHARIPRLPGRCDRRPRRRRRCARRGLRDVRRRSRDRADVPRGRRPSRPGALRRLDDGQGARRLRPHLPADQDAPLEQGHSRRSARRRRRTASTAS